MGAIDLCMGCDQRNCDYCSVHDELSGGNMRPLTVQYNHRKFDRIGVLNALIRILCPDLKEKTMIDAFCHKAEYTRTLPFRTKTFIDCVDYSKIVGRFGGFKQMNCLNLDGWWDFLYCGDGIEHMTEVDAVKFIEIATKISGVQLFVTPLGKLWYDPESKDPNAHKSWWDPGQLGFLAPGKFDCLVFDDWYRELVEHPALIFYTAQSYAKTQEIVAAVNDIMERTAK